nr:MAG TPA: hypothetical protein [Caudoviricetes sp.]
MYNNIVLVCLNYNHSLTAVTIWRQLSMLLFWF